MVANIRSSPITAEKINQVASSVGTVNVKLTCLDSNKVLFIIY